MSGTATSARQGAWFSGLDGLRAIAVAAVVVFHFAPGLLPGGFLGVDLFFVISGYLITRLLLAEIEKTGRISLRAFYLRRARRLLPAVIVLLLVTSICAALVWRDEIAAMRGGILASLCYVTNWWLIGAHESYFVAAGRPSMLQHLWSLAIEEQFYLIWPMALLLLSGVYVVWRGRAGPAEEPATVTPRTLHRICGVAVLLAGASTLAMALIAIHADVPYGADSGRVYFGTDTHSMGLLLGAAAGAFASSRGRRRARSRIPAVLRSCLLSDAAAVLALLGLTRIVTGIDEFSPWMYRGGFLVVSALCMVAVLALTRPGSAVGWLLDRAPLRWVGARSYSIYLWHWPVAVVTRPDVDINLSGWQLFALRLVLTLALAETSYELIEGPIRRYGWQGLAKAWGWRRLSPAARARLAPLAVAGGVVVVAVLATAFTGTQPRPAPAASYVAARSQTGRMPTSAHSSASRPARPHPQARRPSGAQGTTRPAPRHQTWTPTPAPVPTVSAFGDSVMLGAARDLCGTLPHADVTAVEGEQARELFDTVEQRRSAGTLGMVVVVHTGNNGIISPDDLGSVLRSLSDRKRVVLLTDRVPRDWQDPNNDMLRHAVSQFPNARLVDWYDVSKGHQDWFYDDGIHLRPAGAAAYTGFIVAAVRR